MGKRLDLRGMKFGRLEVISFFGLSDRNMTKWNCKCDCGNVKVVLGSDMRNGKSLSCGCLRKEITGKRFRTHGQGNTKDMKETYQEHLTIDRRDFNGNYEKENCRGATMEVQWNNTRKCVFIEIDGVTDTVKNMCRKYNSKYDRVVRYIKQGKDPWEMIQKYKLD